jgi:hypothetical protein
MKVTSAEEDSNNQIDMMACSVDTNQPLSQLPLPLPKGLMNKVVVMATKDVKHGLND